jgi:GNAT superfamily N-acetyltransferase
MELKATRLGELGSRPPTLQPDQNGVVPFSVLRQVSYLRNPRALDSDPVLFEAWDGARLVAYRTLLPDSYRDTQGTIRRFAWLSGNFVLPGYRRMGISTRLLELAETSWEGRLMYTNYAPSSKALYDQTGRFRLLAGREGSRFHLRSASAELLAGRMGTAKWLKRGSGILLQAGDDLINRIRESRLGRFAAPAGEGSLIEEISAFDPQIKEVIDRIQADSLFGRDAGVLSWILENPWVTDLPGEPIPYHFSYRVRTFKNILLKFTHASHARPGLLWMVLHNRKMTVPYLFTETNDWYPSMAAAVIRSMIDHGAAYTTIRNRSLQDALRAHRSRFLAIRNMPQLIFVHEKIAPTVPSGSLIHDGDGDVVFSG